MTEKARDLDVVALVRPSGIWPAGTEGTIVWVDKDFVTMEVGMTEPGADKAEFLDLLVDVPYDAVRILKRFERHAQAA